jgi:hypothetical protein
VLFFVGGRRAIGRRGSSEGENTAREESHLTNSRTEVTGGFGSLPPLIDGGVAFPCEIVDSVRGTAHFFYQEVNDIIAAIPSNKQ